MSLQSGGGLSFGDIIKFQDFYFLPGGILKIDKSISLISLNISDSSQKIKSFILPDLKMYSLVCA